MRLRAEAIALLALAFAAPVAATPAEDASPVRYGKYDATGQASWYGHELAGRRTATGKRFDPDDVMIAHRTLPLESMVEVTDVDTGRAIVARVGDRGRGAPTGWRICRWARPSCSAPTGVPSRISGCGRCRRAATGRA
ncbi:hypothetical protein GCM10020258_36600 [Sphingomonas yabuuchiae]